MAEELNVSNKKGEAAKPKKSFADALRGLTGARKSPKLSESAGKEGGLKGLKAPALKSAAPAPQTAPGAPKPQAPAPPAPGSPAPAKPAPATPLTPSAPAASSAPAAPVAPSASSAPAAPSASSAPSAPAAAKPSAAQMDTGSFKAAVEKALAERMPAKPAPAKPAPSASLTAASTKTAPTPAKPKPTTPKPASTISIPETKKPAATPAKKAPASEPASTPKAPVPPPEKKPGGFQQALKQALGEKSAGPAAFKAPSPPTLAPASPPAPAASTSSSTQAKPERPPLKVPPPPAAPAQAKPSAPAVPPPVTAQGEVRFATGVPGLDSLLSGGFMQNDFVLVYGPSGSGKSTLALHFLMEGARSKQTGLYISMEEDPEDLKRRLLAINPEVKPALDAQAISIIQPDAFEFSKLLNFIQKKAVEHKASRLVVDPISLLTAQFKTPAEGRHAVLQLLQLAKRVNCTTLVLGEPSQGNAEPLQAFEAYVSDGVLSLTLERAEDRFVRTLSVPKLRHSRHSLNVHPIAISLPGGLTVYTDQNPPHRG